MQQAQPATFGHYLLAFHARLADCFQQLSQLYDRVNRCPLGAVGLSGTELPIDRTITASLLGFPAIQDNSLTGRDAYYQIEFAFSLGIVMTILNDLCTDLHIHSATEFGYVELDDSHCSTSSIFPQKKNPVALEAVKLTAAESHGWVAAALAIFRNEGTADQYYRSLPFLPTACTSTANMLRL
ncbi:L-Aspartase-like protein, partial [Aspergillus germanicus]